MRPAEWWGSRDTFPGDRQVPGSSSAVPNKIGSPVGKDEFDPTRQVGNLVGRAGQPEEIAKTMLFLTTDD
jgi:hypothetical protein